MTDKDKIWWDENYELIEEIQERLSGDALSTSELRESLGETFYSAQKVIATLKRLEKIGFIASEENYVDGKSQKLWNMY